MNAELEKGRCLCGKVNYSFNQSYEYQLLYNMFVFPFLFIDI